jgi:hypothetical protein
MTYTSDFWWGITSKLLVSEQEGLVKEDLAFKDSGIKSILCKCYCTLNTDNTIKTNHNEHEWHNTTKPIK